MDADDRLRQGHRKRHLLQRGANAVESALLSGAGGTVYYCDNPDEPGATATGQLAFYGIANYDPSLNSKVIITTPLTSDSAGNIYFGFNVLAANSLNLAHGIARMSPDGTGTWISASRAAKTTGSSIVLFNAAPALSPDEKTLYVPIGSGTVGKLVSIDTTSFRPLNRVTLIDPKTGQPAYTASLSSAVPTVGPDGDVYFGVTGFGSKGWMLHYSADLQTVKTPGAFGWDNTASIVPRDMVPSYNGPSPYLITTKYNDYIDEDYRVAVLDPNVTMVDPYTGVVVMNEVLVIDSPSPWEWCVNAAAVDRGTKSVLINNADGKLYRWDLTTNSFSDVIKLADGYFEAYTPTLVGADGTVYAINKAALYAVQSATTNPEGGRGFDLFGMIQKRSAPPSELTSRQDNKQQEDVAEIELWIANGVVETNTINRERGDRPIATVRREVTPSHSSLFLDPGEE